MWLPGRERIIKFDDIFNRVDTIHQRDGGTDGHRTTYAKTALTHSVARQKKTETILATRYILPRHWLYELFSQIHSCGTYSVLSRSPSFIKSSNKQATAERMDGQITLTSYGIVVVTVDRFRDRAN